MTTSGLALRSVRVTREKLLKDVATGNRLLTSARAAGTVKSIGVSQQQRWLAVGGGPEFGGKGEIPEEEPDLCAGDGRDRASQGKSAKRTRRKWVRDDPFEDLCRIKWEPDPDLPPKGWLPGHIPDQIKVKMFKLFQEDPIKNSAKVLAKRFGIRFILVQGILTLKKRGQWHLDNTPGYKVYQWAEDEMTMAKQEYHEDICLDYGVDFPFLYEPSGEIDFEDPENWRESGGTGRDTRTACLEETDPNDKWDNPPLRTQQEIVDDLHTHRAKKAQFKVDRQCEADRMTRKLKTTTKLPKKRWAYVLKDISTEKTKEAAPIMRAPDGRLRGTAPDEEKTLTWAPDEYFRREVARRKSLMLDVN